MIEEQLRSKILAKQALIGGIGLGYVRLPLVLAGYQGKWLGAQSRYQQSQGAVAGLVDSKAGIDSYRAKITISPDEKKRPGETGALPRSFRFSGIVTALCQMLVVLMPPCRRVALLPIGFA
jgi:hypothetical protein